MQKADSIPSAGTNVDSSTKGEVPTSSSNDTKPNVVGSQCHITPKEFNNLNILITDKKMCESQIALIDYYFGGDPTSNSKS